MGHTTHAVAGNGKFNYFSKGKIRYKVDGEPKESDGLEGYVLAMDIELDDYEGKEYEKVVLYMTDSSNDEFVLSFPLTSGYGIAFCKMAKNVDWKKPVHFSGKCEKVEGKQFPRTSMFIKQPDANGKLVNIKWAYTKDAPGKMPLPVESTDRNGKFWDFSKQNAFFRKLLVDLVYKEIKKAWPDQDSAKLKAKSKEVKAEDITEPIDDMPF